MESWDLQDDNSNTVFRKKENKKKTHTLYSPIYSHRVAQVLL